MEHKYKCDMCDETFKFKSLFDRHVNRKIPCCPDKKAELKIDNCTCEYCNKKLSRPQHLQRHLQICKEKPTKIEKLEQIILELKNEIKKNNDKPNVTNNNTYIQNNIIVLPFGKEDISFITLEDYKNIIKKGCYSIPELMKLIHCNNNKPEYRNIYIKNYKDDYILTFDGTDWNIEKKDDVFGNMIENKKNFLESKYEDFHDELSKPAKSAFKKFLERSDNNEVINNIKDELKNIFYKNRNHVIKKVTKVKKLKNKPN